MKRRKVCFRANNLGDSLISCLRENCKIHNLIALSYFLRSKLSKCNYLGKDNLMFFFYILISICQPLFHLQILSVRDTNFVHWLSSFCYPDRTTATLLDQMDHPFGYTFRPANKTTYNSSNKNVTGLRV